MLWQSHESGFFVGLFVCEDSIMDWLLAGLLPDVSVALVGVLDGNLVLAVRVLQIDGELLFFNCSIPLEDVRAKLQEGLDATRK